jgi:sterol desaturase/sphingolipid hydroxylase (fatty acid hydroxylase superfamily)
VVSTLIYFAIPVFVLSILGELLFAKLRGLSLYEWKDTWANLAMGLGNVIVAALVKTATFVPFFWLYENHRLFEFPASLWWSWALLLVAEDFCYYWFHRCHHRVRVLWAAHVNHHSSRHFNLAVALRQSWTTPLTGFVFWLPLAWLGFHPLMILTQQAVSLLYQFGIHTQTVGRLGPLEWVMNTPSHHRVHHGRNEQYLDRNYGGIFIVWDRLFGSFEPERERVDYGLVKNIETFNPVKIAFHEWADIGRDVARARNWRGRLRAAFASPTELALRPPS